MRFGSSDLGEQVGGTRVVARLRGSRANVILVDAANFARYRAGQSFGFTGGMQAHTPVELTIPKDGHWYLVVDHGGFRGRIRGEVEVIHGDEIVQRSSIHIP